MSKTPLMQEIENRHGAPLEELIARMVAEGRSREDMARRFDISYWTLMGWLKKLDARFETTVTFGGEKVGR